MEKVSVSPPSIYEVVVNMLCEIPSEVDSGRIYEAYEAYLERNVPSIRKLGYLEMTVVQHLVDSGDLICCKVPYMRNSRFQVVTNNTGVRYHLFYSVRRELMRIVGFRSMRNPDVPLLYYSENENGT